MMWVRVLSAVALPFIGSAYFTTLAHWETTRKTVIDPINSEFHRHLPTFVKRRDLEAVVELYATSSGTGLTWE